MEKDIIQALRMEYERGIHYGYQKAITETIAFLCNYPDIDILSIFEIVNEYKKYMEDNNETNMHVGRFLGK